MSGADETTHWGDARSRVVRLETNGSSEPVVGICPRKSATIVATTDDGALVDWTVGDTQIVDPSPDNSITVGAGRRATPGTKETGPPDAR